MPHQVATGRCESCIEEIPLISESSFLQAAGHGLRLLPKPLILLHSVLALKVHDRDVLQLVTRSTNVPTAMPWMRL